MFSFFRDHRHQGFVRLWVAQIISQFGDRLNQMALIGLIAERALHGQAPPVGDYAKILSFTIIPVFIVGPVAGVLVDRWDHRRTLFFCDLLRAGLVFLIALWLMDQTSLWPFYGVIFLIFCLSRFYVPAKMAILPDLVAKENLLLANSLMTTTGMIAFVLGCALGGFFVEGFGARGGFLGDGVTFLVSALLIFPLRPRIKSAMPVRTLVRSGKEFVNLEKSVWREVKEGIHYLFSKREFRFVMSVLFILLAAGGSVYVILIVFIQEVFQSVTRDVGILSVCMGVGLFVSALAYGRWGGRFVWFRTIFFCLFLAGIMMGLFTLGVSQSANRAIAGVLAMGLGAVMGPVFIAANTVVHWVSREEMRGKVFSALEIVIHLAFLIAMGLSAVLARLVPVSAILLGVGVGCALVGLIGLFRYRPGSPLASDLQNMA